ncbi:MAG TPA: hypothetical protein VFV19_04475 [Candidatus Polarisedimenticolaceae bacterium]|nr:hypothetical protein [Candidatus Polarisedimenticolaceae bacterium]
MEDRSLALGEIAWDVLHRLVRERLSRKAGAHLIEGAIDRITLEVALPLRGLPAPGEAFARALVDQIDRILDAAIQHAASFRPGHAFCHRCGVTPCEHSAAPSHRHVFAGYTPTGAPRWEDFAQLCLDLRHPEVDRLYADPPAFVSLVRSGAELNAALLDAFRGAAGYELMGQVAAGFFPVRTRDGEGRGVLALTFQIGRSQRFGLNVLGRTPQGEPLDLLWERQDLIPWKGAVSWAQAALQTLDRGRRRKDEEVRARIDGILRGLERRLAHERRASGRRTRHAAEHHAKGRRPTKMAIEDARGARPEDVMVDERHGTLVVAGERGRMHFYTRDGKLVSSVRYSKDAIERKRKLGIWRDASADEAAALASRINLEGSGRPGE